MLKEIEARGPTPTEEVHRKASILSKAIVDMPPKIQVALVADRRGKYKVKSRREYGE